MSVLVNFCPHDAVLWLAANVLAQIAMVAALAWLLSLGFARRRPAVAYGIWLCALACVLASPALAYLGGRAGLSLVSLRLLPRPEAHRSPVATPAVPLPDRVQPAAAIGTTPVKVHRPSPVIPPPDTAVSPAVSPAHSTPAAAAELAPATAKSPAASPPVNWQRTALGAVSLAWSAGILFLVARLLHGWRGVVRLRRMAQPLAGGRLQAVLSEVRHGLKVDALPALAVLPVEVELAGPITVGVLRPLVILPEKLVGSLDSRGLRDVLLHEFAHALRRDPLVGFVQRLAATIYWPYPPAHFVNRRLVRAREEVCDNYVLREGDVAAYAETLLAISERFRSIQPQPAMLGLCHPHVRLEQRVAGLLDPRRNVMVRMHRVAMGLVVGVFAAAAVTVAGTRLLRAEPPAATPAATPAAKERQATPPEKPGEVAPLPPLPPEKSGQPVPGDLPPPGFPVTPGPSALPLAGLPTPGSSAPARRPPSAGRRREPKFPFAQPRANSGPPVERRAVNKRVKDFPQKTDLSTPESAQAAVYRAIGRPDAGALANLAMIDPGWETIARTLSDARQSDPRLPAWTDISQAMGEVEIVDVLTYRDDLAVVISKGNSKDPDLPLDWNLFGRIKGLWKADLPLLDKCGVKSTEAGMGSFNDNRAELWRRFTIVREKAVGVRGSPAAPPPGRGGPTSKDVARIGPLDLLSIRAVRADRRFTDGYYLVEPDGRVPLGAPFGRAEIAGMTMEQAEEKIDRRLTNSVYLTPQVQVTMAIKRAPDWLKADYPSPRYTIGPGDVLFVHAVGTPIDQPIDGFFGVEHGGTVALGPVYGRAQVGGLTLEAAEVAVDKQLSLTLAQPAVQVTLPCGNGYEWPKVGGKMVAPASASPIGPDEWLVIRVIGAPFDQPIDGYFRVESEGTVALGPAYGRVKVKGLTIEEAIEAIRKELSLRLEHPDVDVTRPLPDAVPPHQFTWRETAPPTVSYTIGVGDVLHLRVSGADAGERNDGFCLVEPSGELPLGPGYGRVQVKGLSLEAAENAVEKKLSEVLARPGAQLAFGGWKDWRRKQPAPQ